MNLIRDTFKKKTYTGVHFGFGSFNNLRKATLRYGHYLKAKKYLKRPNHGQKPDNRAKVQKGGRGQANL